MTTRFAAIAILIFLLDSGGFAAPTAAVDTVSDDGNTMSLNNEVVVVPTPGTVTIDGATGDWDLSAGFWSYNSPIITEKFSLWTHMMWDEKGVYFLARYYDATPMKNATRGKDLGNSWKNDCYQARMVFDNLTPEEHQMHINLFYSTPEQTAYMLVHHGGGFGGSTGPDRPDLLERFGNTMEKAGGKIAIKKWDDGKGYNIEAFWPWKYCRVNGKALAPGNTFVFGMEAMWGNPDGTLGWPAHRLADLIKSDKTSRIFMFWDRDGWGKAVISAKGNLGITAYQEALQVARFKRFNDYGTYGVAPISYTLAADRDVTIAIDDARGNRVRNLFGQYPRKKGSVTDQWDGMDDAGKPVAPGTYTAYVVDHDPVSLQIINSCFNSGVPPWPTETGTHTWGSNHGHPATVAMDGDVMIAGFHGTEGTTGLLRLDSTATRIAWANQDQVFDVAIAGDLVYTVSEGFLGRSGTLNLKRYNNSNGLLLAFDTPEKNPEAQVLDPADARPGGTLASSMAFCRNKVFVLVPMHKFMRFNPATGKREASMGAADLVAIHGRNDKLYALTTAGDIVLLNDDIKVSSTVCNLKGLTEPKRLGVAQDEKTFAVSDWKTNQVILFDAKGKVLRKIGSAYAGNSRPAGKFIETDLIHPLGIDIDSKGRLWIAEANSSTRRVTTWSADGKLLNSFWGSSDYGATAGFAVTYDSRRFIAHGIEFALDPNPDLWKRPTSEKPLLFHPDLSSRGFVYQYKGHEYAVALPGFNETKGFTIAKRGKDGTFHTCVKVNYPPKTAWIDQNDNGIEEDNEITREVKGSAHYWSAGWCRPDMTILTADGWLYPLKSLTATGVPVYDFAKPTRPANIVESRLWEQGATGTLVMDNQGNITDGIRYAMVDGRQGAYPNRYGRHDAPAAQRGVLIAPFRTNGVVEGVSGVGSITALGGDRGEWFVMTFDGIYLSNIFQDIKGDPTLDETFIGGENFGGLLWRDETGRILLQSGSPSYRIFELKGLETCRRQSIPVTITEAQIQQGLALVASRKRAQNSEPEKLQIVKIAKLPSQPVSPDQSKAEPLIPGASDVLVTEQGNSSQWWRTSLAHDGKNLAIMFQIGDQSPWRNGEGRFTHAFIGGDAVDLKLMVPGRGEMRLLAAPLTGKDVAIYWQKTASKKETPTSYFTPAGGTQAFDVVRIQKNATVTSAKGAQGYSVLVTVPLEELGIDPAKTTEIKGLVGVIYSDPSGKNRAARMYWHDKATSLVNDVPSEAKLDAGTWGAIIVGR